MARLERDALGRWPGMTIFDIGDPPHSRTKSGHNPDDPDRTPLGGGPEQTDADNKSEVRAKDFMIGPKFSKANAAELFEALSRRPANQKRLLYVIYNKRIRSAASGWVDKPYTGTNPHTDHVHASGAAKDDDNSAGWDIGPTSEGASVSAETDGLKAILTGSGSGTLGADNNLHVKINKLQTTLDEVLKNAKGASLRAGAIMDMADVVTSWSDVAPKGIQENKLADAVLVNGTATVDVAALAAALSAMLPEGVGLTKADVRAALADVLNRGADAPTE